jgi:hypothetical protein
MRPDDRSSRRADDRGCRAALGSLPRAAGSARSRSESPCGAHGHRWRRPLTQSAVFVHQMQGHARPERLALHWLQAQSKSQVPRRRCSGAKSQIPTWLPDFVGQQLANFSLEAGQIARLKALLTLGALGTLCLDLLGYRSRATGVEFFFANRSR